MPEVWTSLQFDFAVALFGNTIEGLLLERDTQNRPMHNLEDLLREQPKPSDGFQSFLEYSAEFQGALRIVKKKKR